VKVEAIAAFLSDRGQRRTASRTGLATIDACRPPSP
jgi:hypothetical protein